MNGSCSSLHAYSFDPEARLSTENLEAAGGSPAHGTKQSTSELLLHLIRSHPRERMSVRELIDGLGERGFGFVMLVFGLPAAIPNVPGLTSIFGIPVMMFAVQMMLRRPKPWLPRRVADKTIARLDLERVAVKGAKWMSKVEKLCKPRLTFLVGPWGERFLGLVLFLLGLFIALPGPGTNGPPGAAIVVLAIAMIELDGLMILIGLAASVAAMVIASLGAVAFLLVVWYGIKELFY